MSSLIVVPYRNRPDHLTGFVSWFNKHQPTQKICIVEQSERKQFNRAKLLNVGYLENSVYDFYIFHDIDMLPLEVDYSEQSHIQVKQLACSIIQKHMYLGGVTMFNKQTFIQAGGYNNDYYHRAEDNEMRFNLLRLQVPVFELYGSFSYLHHKKSGPDFMPALWAKAQEPRKVHDQLSICQYKLLSVTDSGNVKHIIVDL